MSKFVTFIRISKGYRKQIDDNDFVFTIWFKAVKKLFFK